MHGEDLAKKLAEEVTRKISNSDSMPYLDEDQEEEMKEIVKETVKEIL